MRLYARNATHTYTLTVGRIGRDRTTPRKCSFQFLAQSFYLSLRKSMNSVELVCFDSVCLHARRDLITLTQIQAHVNTRWAMMSVKRRSFDFRWFSAVFFSLRSHSRVLLHSIISVLSLPFSVLLAHAAAVKRSSTLLPLLSSQSTPSPLLLPLLLILLR